MDRDSLQDQGVLPFYGKRPMLGPCDKIGILQLLGVPIFSLLQGFRHGSLTTFCGCHIGVRLSELHFEHPRKDLDFLSSAEALPQLLGLPVVLLIQSNQIPGQIYHGWAVFLRVPHLQSLHASPPYTSILFQRWKELHGGTSSWLFIDLAKTPQGFVGHNLVGVD